MPGTTEFRGKKNNILLISSLPPPEGGMTTWTVKYQKYFKSIGISLDIVNIALVGKRGHRINAKRSIVNEIGRTFHIIKALFHELRKNNYDIAHINTSCSKYGIARDYLLQKIIARHGIPTVVECHCDLDFALNTGFKRRVFRRMVRDAKRVLVLNEKSSRKALDLTGRSVDIIPNFIDVDYLNGGKKIDEKVQNMLFVGHVQILKGCGEIIEAARQFPAMIFTLVGPVSEEIKQMELPANVILPGNKSAVEVREYMNRADVFLFPSYTEGFSVSLLEAMACGLPVIATDVGANREMLENIGGIIVPPQNAEVLTKAFEQIMDVSTRRNMSDWNVKKVKKEYLTDIVMKRLIDIYNEVLSIV